MANVREVARVELQVYQSKSGLSLRQIADRTKSSYYSMRHLAAGADYAKDGEGIAHTVLEFIRSNPPVPLRIPGQLYETQATHAMDDLLRECQEGCWGTLYGPAGAQKSYLLEYRAAEAARDPEPWLVVVDIAGPMTSCALLMRIARAVGAPYAQSAEGLRNSICSTVASRQTSLTLVLDEAQLLYKSVDALETLRRLADSLPVRLGRAGVGLTMVGNEQLLDLFKPRGRWIDDPENRRPGSNYFEQWRSRIEQWSVRVLGPTKGEACEMVRGELGDIPPQIVLQAVDRCVVKDPVSGRHYVNVRKLFNSLRDVRRSRGNGKGRTQ